VLAVLRWRTRTRAQ